MSYIFKDGLIFARGEASNHHILKNLHFSTLEELLTYFKLNISADDLNQQQPFHLEREVEIEGEQLTLKLVKLRFELGDLIQAILLDSTPERSLIENEEKYRSLFESSLDAIFITSVGGKLIEWNRSFVDMFDYSDQELVDIDVRSFYFDEADRKTFLEMVDEEKQVSNVEITLRKKSGAAIHCLISAEGIYEDGRLARIKGIIKDISDLKNATDALINSEKLNSIGLLAGGIAHDINNMLTAVTGYSSIVLEMIDNPEIVKMINQMKENADRAADLTDKLLAFAGRKTKITESLDLAKEIDSLRDFLSITTTPSTSIEYQLMPCGNIVADKTQLSQIMLNMVANAIESMPNGGKVVIRTGTMHLDEQSIKQFDLIRPSSSAFGTYHYVSIQDEGSGINKTEIQRIFEPFYSTKSTGSGMGLSATQGIVQSHEGSIAIETSSRGSTFFVLFPSVSLVDNHQYASNLVTKRDQLNIPYNSVLVLDDQESILFVIRHICESVKLACDTTSDITEMLELLQNRDYDLVILDQSMPKIQGMELARKLVKEGHHSGDIMIMSGFSRGLINLEGSDLPIKEFIQKPFTKSKFLSHLQS